MVTIFATLAFGTFGINIVWPFSWLQFSRCCVDTILPLIHEHTDIICYLNHISWISSLMGHDFSVVAIFSWTQFSLLVWTQFFSLFLRHDFVFFFMDIVLYFWHWHNFLIVTWTQFCNSGNCFIETFLQFTHGHNFATLEIIFTIRGNFFKETILQLFHEDDWTKILT